MLSGTRSENKAPLGSFERFYDESVTSMLRFSFLLTGDRGSAEDVTQDAYAEVLRRFDGVENPRAYLRRCVVNSVNRRARREGLFRRSVEQLPRTASVTDQPAEMRDLFTLLTLRQRTAVFLRYYLDLSEADMAAAMGCRPGTVKSTLSSALDRLREALDDQR